MALVEGRRLYEEHVGRPEVLGGCAPSTRKRYRTAFDKLLQFAASKGVSTWDEVTDKFLTDYATQLEKGFANRPQGYSPKSIQNELTTIKQAHAWLVQEGHLVITRPLTLKVRKVESEPYYCYRKVEVEAMIDFCQQQGLLWLHDIIVALACTGLRIGELASLRWSSFDDKLERILLNDERSHLSRRGREARRIKNRKSRWFPIHKDLQQILNRLPRNSAHVFRGPGGGKLKADVFTRKLRQDVIGPLAQQFPVEEGERGFQDGVAHSFRHYFCSTCANSNVPEQMVMAWLGHSESKMVKHYYHLQDEESQLRMRQIDFLGGAARRSERSQQGPQEEISEQNREPNGGGLSHFLSH